MLRTGGIAMAVAFCGCSDSETTPSPDPKNHTPRWAFEPWISKDISTTQDTRSFVQGFKDRKIPVGVVVLDSPWETNYNTFVPNPSRYPDFADLVSDLRDDGIRTVLWVTQMVNETSFDAEVGGDEYPPNTEQFGVAKASQYLVNEGATYFWWKGVGGGLDFFNPDATAWWHGLQDPLYALGVAGFKLDFGESYLPTATISTARGIVTHQEYSEAYYRDFFIHGVATRGRDEFVTMVRPYDKSYQFEGRFFARKEHAPVAWVGDNRRDFVGMKDALDHILRSAVAGYAVVGSDLGGYLDRDDRDLLERVPFDAEVFLRWIGLSAMTPFMQLHGRANLEPWATPERSDEIVRTYRYFATLHHELVPFFYALAEEAHARGTSILHPISDRPEDWSDDYSFEVGSAFFVAPMVNAGSTRDVALPAGRRWYDWWDLAAPPSEGGSLLQDFDPGSSGRIPIFIGEGAIIPMTVTSSVTGWTGDPAGIDVPVVLAVPGGPATFDGELPVAIDARQIRFPALPRGVYLLLRLDERPTQVMGAGPEVSLEVIERQSGWAWDEARKLLKARLPVSAAASEVTFE